MSLHRKQGRIGSDGLDTCIELTKENQQKASCLLCRMASEAGEETRTRWKDNIKRDMQELNLTAEDAENREQRTKNREQRTENREQRTENREQWSWWIRATNPD